MEHRSAEKEICVVLVHGIGDVGAGAVIQSAEDGIRRSLPGEVEVLDRRVLGSRARPAAGRAHIESLRLKWRDVNIELLEFNWTGVTGKMRMRRPLQALWRLMETVREAPSLALDTDSSAPARWFVALVGWYQWLLVGLFAFLVAGSIAEVLAMPEVLTCDPEHLAAGTLHTGCDPRVQTGTQNLQINPFSQMVLSGYEGLLWNAGYRMSAGLYWIFMAATLWAVVVLFVAAPLLLLALGRLLLPRRVPWPVLAAPRTILASAAVTLLVVLTAFLFHAAATSAVAIGYVAIAARKVGVADVVTWGVFAMILFLYARVVLGVANLLRDVIHYLSAAPGAARRAHGEELRRQLSLLLSGLVKRPEAPRLVLVSHSLGTVILLDLLLTDRNLGAESPTAVDIVTAGSPIRRLINRMLPQRLPEPAELSSRLRQNPRLRVRRWFNVYRIFDYVGQGLTRSALPRELFAPRRPDPDPSAGIGEHLLEPRLRWPLGHANYWRDGRFLKYLAAAVLRPLLVPAGQ